MATTSGHFRTIHCLKLLTQYFYIIKSNVHVHLMFCKPHQPTIIKYIKSSTAGSKFRYSSISEISSVASCGVCALAIAITTMPPQRVLTIILLRQVLNSHRCKVVGRSLPPPVAHIIKLLTCSITAKFAAPEFT